MYTAVKTAVFFFLFQSILGLRGYECSRARMPWLHGVGVQLLLPGCSSIPKETSLVTRSQMTPQHLVCHFSPAGREQWRVNIAHSLWRTGPGSRSRDFVREELSTSCILVPGLHLTTQKPGICGKLCVQLRTRRALIRTEWAGTDIEGIIHNLCPEHLAQIKEAVQKITAIVVSSLKNSEGEFESCT